MSALIYAQIPKIIHDIGGIEKNRKNVSQGYSYRGIDDVYDSLSPVLSKHKCFICPEVLEHQVSERTTKSGTVMIYTTVKVRFKIYAEDGSFVEVITLGEASDSGDKSAKKALSAAFSYMAFQVFCIPTGDPESDSESHSPEFATATRTRPMQQLDTTTSQVKPKMSQDKPKPKDDF